MTAPNIKCARSLAKAVLGAKAAACANLLPGIESHYWWQGKVEHGREVLIIFKTSRDKLPLLEKIVLEEHPYDTPEILALSVHAGTKRYLDWLAGSVR